MSTARYSTGEEPRVGDVVHRVLDGTMPAGEVHVVKSDYVTAHITVEGDPRSFETYRFALIARAGEPVKYQPGDVVEFLREGRPWNPCGPGDRDTVTGLDDDGCPVLAQDYDPDPGWFTGLSMPFFRLVYRPVTAAAEQPEQPPVGVPLTAETAKLLRPGDVLRATETTCNFCAGDLLTFEGPGPLGECMVNGMSWRAHRFTFIGRPDADGWITWAGGECLLPGDTVVQMRARDGYTITAQADDFVWHHVPAPQRNDPNCDIVAFRILQPTPAAEETRTPPSADAPVRCAYEAAADDVRDQVARLNDAVLEAQAVGVSCEFDTRADVVTVTCRREV